MNGAECYAACKVTPALQHLRNTPGEIAVKAFLPPEPQDLMQFARPRGAVYTLWISEWDAARAAEENS